MKGILAIETATEACSVALWRNSQVQQRHEITPRQHSQRLFGMLRELLPEGELRQQGVEAIAYGSGPGSFTGLRIAASAVQGLAYACQLPAIPVSTLACQAQTALREGLVEEGGVVFSALDARINEIYHACYRIQEGLPVMLAPPQASDPAEVILAEDVERAVAIGSGARFLSSCPDRVCTLMTASYPDLLPQARDLLPLALASAERGDLQSAIEVQPVYVRDEINWKKISEQGKRS
jgi:tRNA threonylcarbamoyladenosine biosynthesis protein TsaB